MATYTSFLNLEKPTTSERLDVLKINSNWDKIDEGVSSLNSNLTTKIPSTAKIGINYANGTQYTFPVTKTNAGAYSYFLLVGGSSSSSGFVYHGFIHVSGNYATSLTLIGGTAVPGIEASYDGTNLVITVTNTQYGGLRLIWLG